MFDILATGFGAGLLIFVIYTMRSKKVTLEEIVISNSSATFKVIQTLSTAIETVGLSLIGIDRGQPSFSAFARYGLIGVGEILLTLLFIMSYEHQLKQKAKDGIISLGDIIKVSLISFPLFAAAFYITNQIHWLYLESINIIEVIQDVTAFMPFFGTSFETDPAFFSAAMRDVNGDLLPQGRQEYGAWIMIYATPIFNIIGVIFITMEIIRKSGNFQLFATKPKVKEAKKTEPIIPKTNVNLGGLQNYLETLTLAFNIDVNKFYKWLSDKIGIDIVTGVKNNTILTSKAVVDGTKKPEEELQDISDELIGIGTDLGLAKLKSLNDEVKTFVTTISANVTSMEEIDKKRATATAGEKANLNTDYNDARNKAKSESLKLKNVLKQRKDVINDIGNTLETANFKDFDKSYEDKAGKDASDLVKKVEAIRY